MANCRFPLWDDNQRPHWRNQKFCNCPNVFKASLCEEHYKICHIPDTRKREKVEFVFGMSPAERKRMVERLAKLRAIGIDVEMESAN